MEAQLSALVTALRETSGSHKAALMHLVAGWMTFVGWLNIGLGEYSEADAALAAAEEMSDELGDGTLAAVATSYRGYIALLQGRHRGAGRRVQPETIPASLSSPGAG